MIKNVLVPIDYSEASLNALDTAIHIAAINNASLKIFHVNDTMAGSEAPHVEAKTKVIFDTIAPKVLARYNVKSTTVSAEGIVGHAIINAVLEYKIDLIIMGSHGTSGGRNLFIGLNSYYTIKRATCPVLLIPEGKKWYEFGNVLFPIRPSLFTFRHYRLLDNLIKKNEKSSVVQFLGIATEGNEEEAHQLISILEEVKLKKQALKTALSFSFNSNPDIAEGVLSFAKQTRADLLVISLGLDVISRPFFIGSFSQRMINHAKIPILSILRIS